MRRELRDKIAIAGMAQNPLLATLLCMAFSPNSWHTTLPFPLRRIDVYERVLRGLLGEWEALDKREEVNRDLLEAKLRLLEELAYRFFPTEELGGDTLHDFLWNERDGYLSRLADIHPLKKALRVESNVTMTGELCKDGILIPCGAPESQNLMFLHLTFHEYFTACAIARRANNGGWPTISALVTTKAWEPAWQEVVILLAGRVNDPGPLMKALTDPGADDIFRYSLALASLCLDELAENARSAIPAQIDYITTEVVSLWAHHEENRTHLAVSHLQYALPVLARVNGRLNGMPLLSGLARVVSSSESALSWDEALFWDSVRSLLQGTVASDQLSSAIAKARGGYPEWALRSTLAQLRAGNPQHNKKAIRTLASVVCCVIQSAAGKFSWIKRIRTMWRFPAWLDQFYNRWLAEFSDHTHNKGFSTATALRAIEAMGASAAKPEVLAALSNLLPSGGDHRYTVVHILESMGAAAASPDIILQLLDIALHDDLRDWKDVGFGCSHGMRSMHSIAHAAVVKMSHLVVQFPDALCIVASALLDQNSEIRARAWNLVHSSWGPVPSMSSEVIRHPLVLPNAFAAMDEENALFSAFASIEAVASAAEEDPSIRAEAVRRLTRILTDSERPMTRYSAASTLGRLLEHYPEFSEDISSALDGIDNGLYLASIKLVPQLKLDGIARNEGSRIFSALIPSLKSEKWDVRHLAAEALGQFGEGVNDSHEIVSALLETLTTGEDTMRTRAVNAFTTLSQSIPLPPEVILALTRALDDEDPSVRDCAKEALTATKRTWRHAGVLDALLTHAQHDTSSYIRRELLEFWSGPRF